MACKRYDVPSNPVETVKDNESKGQLTLDALKDLFPGMAQVVSSVIETPSCPPNTIVLIDGKGHAQVARVVHETRRDRFDWRRTDVDPEIKDLQSKLADAKINSPLYWEVLTRLADRLRELRGLPAERPASLGKPRKDA